jgi:hypothetical protein
VSAGPNCRINYWGANPSAKKNGNWPEIQKIESLYERWVPEPVNEADDMRHINDFVDTLKRVVVTAISGTRKAIDAEASSPVDVAAG